MISTGMLNTRGKHVTKVCVKRMNNEVFERGRENVNRRDREADCKNIDLEKVYDNGIQEAVENSAGVWGKRKAVHINQGIV